MRVVCLLGSPRQGGNSDAMALRFCQTAKSNGADVQVFALRDLRYSGYQPPSDGLYERSLDDLDEVLEEVEGTDILVLSTPVYFCDISGQLKLALDRFYVFLEADAASGGLRSTLQSGKTLVFLQAQSNGANSHRDLLDHYRPAFEELNFKDIRFLRACDVEDERDIRQHDQVLAKAETLAEELVRSEYA